MTRFEAIKKMSKEELAEYLYVEHKRIEIAKEFIGSLGNVDPDRADIWVKVIEKHLDEEVKR